jgi:SAM-dependent methyltransferase
MNAFRRWFSLRNYKFGFIQKALGSQPFNLLDIGAGNHSASKTKSIFPGCAYHGLDLDKNYNNDAADFAAMAAFYELDLTKLDYSAVQDNHFDYIRMCHVIEHLHNGNEVLCGLLPKLKKGGYFYIEYPGEKSTRLPSMYGSLNFKDDPTHVRVYSVKEISKIFTENGLTVVRGGTRRNIWNIVAIPARVLAHWLRGKKLQGNIFWDLLGFAEYVYAVKN